MEGFCGDLELDVFHRCIQKENSQFFNYGISNDPNSVNMSNEKGETALHIACKHPGENAFIREIIAITEDVNAQNYWKQTPLHYAAAACSVETIMHLLRLPGIDVNLKDVNGYTALHTFVSSCQKFDDKWKKGVSVLVGAEIDINAQTKYGQTILHLAASQKNNSEMLGFIVSNYQNIDLEEVNLFLENFLHIYVSTETGHNCMNFFEKLKQINNTVLPNLLNHQDASGSTPWCLMVENGELTTEHFNRMLEAFGIIIHTTDHLGNTAIHRRVGKGGATVQHNLEICALMFQNGIDKNHLNVFGQSATSLFFYEEVLKLLQKNNVDFKLPDRWGRIPIFYMLQREVNPSIARSILIKNPNMIDTQDNFGATPLHYAAYDGLDGHIQVLLKFNPDLTIKDKLGTIPLDTARRHGNEKCWQYLASEMGLPAEKTDSFLFQCDNKKLPYSFLYEGRSVCEFLTGFPDNLQKFSGIALESKYNARKMMNNCSDVSELTEKVNQHVELICKIVTEYDSRFRMTVFPTGSSAEGTKVGPPDEFDFALCLETLASNCDIETSEYNNPGFAKLRFQENPVPDNFKSFSDNDGCFLALPLLHYLFRYIKKALNERRLWEDGGFYTRSEESFRVVFKKPVFNFDMYWVGAHEKDLKISIDLVPAVYKRGWWPSNTIFDNMKLVNEMVKAAGCFVLMQTEENSFSQGQYMMKDSISLTCNNTDSDNKHRFLLISVAPAEIALMQSLPEIYRQAYALAKIWKSPNVCPDVEIDILPPIIDPSIDQYFRSPYGRRHARSTISPSDEIKSYWVKNSIFYIADENMKHGLKEDTSPLDIAIMAYRKLLNFSQSWNFRPYILHKYDLFNFQSGTYVFDVFITRRKVCFELMLALLGQRPDQNFMEWIKKCQDNYLTTVSYHNISTPKW